MKTGMCSGFSEVVQSSWRAIVMHQRARGVLGVWGLVSIVLESQRMVVSYNIAMVGEYVTNIVPTSCAK